MAETWWLRLRFMEGGWEIAAQTQDAATVIAWDNDIDSKEDWTGVDHEWIVELPYGARPATCGPRKSFVR